MYPETQSEDAASLEEISVVPPFHEFAVDSQRVSDGDSQVMENAQPSRQSQASHQNEGVTSVEPTHQKWFYAPYYGAYFITYLCP
jgi:hypothetical protein